MRITWFGQACFELSYGNGLSVICDPYQPNMGYPPHPRPADAVTISHEHSDHNDTGWIQGSPQVVREIGEHMVKGIRITGLASFHDEQRGAKRGQNTVFVIEAGGVRICHAGDLGHMPPDQLYESIGTPDVLLVPVGGFYTIDAAQAAEITRTVGARLTIPMHFATGIRETPIATVDAFSAASGAVRYGGSFVEFDRGYTGPAVIVLDPLG